MSASNIQPIGVADTYYIWDASLEDSSVDTSIKNEYSGPTRVVTSTCTRGSEYLEPVETNCETEDSDVHGNKDVSVFVTAGTKTQWTTQNDKESLKIKTEPNVAWTDCIDNDFPAVQIGYSFHKPDNGTPEWTEDSYAIYTSSMGEASSSGASEQVHQSRATKSSPSKLTTKQKVFMKLRKGHQDLDLQQSKLTQLVPHKPCPCTFCPMSFGTTKQLMRHMNYHTSRSLPHKCTVCQKGFGEPRTLRRHMLSHTDDRPYKCRVCDKGFRFAFVLSRHMKTHTGEKPICITYKHVPVIEINVKP